MMHSKLIYDSQNTLSLSSKKRLLEQLRREQQEVNAITQPLLETEARFIKDLDLYLTHKDTLDLRKRKLLYKRWTLNVWLPIQRSIQQHFMEHGYNEMQKIRSMHAHYIDYCNAKGFVFLESYDPLEYNPFLLYFSTPQYHKISTPALEDPLSLHSRARIEEKTAILRCQTGHIYQLQQVEEILQSPPATQQSIKQAKTSRDSGSLRLWDCRSRLKTSGSPQSCFCVSSAPFTPGAKERHMRLQQRHEAFTVSVAPLMPDDNIQ